MAGRLRKFSAGASRQRGLETISAGRLWGSNEFALSCATSRHRNRRAGLGDAKSADEISRIALAGTGRGNLGSAGWSQKFHPFENDGVVGVPSGGAIDRRGWSARERRARALEESPRANPSGGLRARLQSESESVYPVLRRRRPRRQLAADADDRVPPDRRRARAQYHRCDRAGSTGARFRAALPAGGGKRRWFARRRRRVLALLVLVRYLSEFDRAQRRSARTFRTPAHVAKRSWFAVGRIRSARKTISGKFSASIYSRLPHRRCSVFGREEMIANPAIPQISPTI